MVGMKDPTSYYEICHYIFRYYTLAVVKLLAILKGGFPLLSLADTAISKRIPVFLTKVAAEYILPVTESILKFPS